MDDNDPINLRTLKIRTSERASARRQCDPGVLNAHEVPSPTLPRANFDAAIKGCG